MEPQVGIVLDIDSAAIASRGAGISKRAGGNASASEGTTVFVRILYGVVAPWAHFVPGRTEGLPFFIKSDVCGGIRG